MSVGAEDGMVFIYNTGAKFKIARKLKGRHTKVTHIDYSEDSKFVQFNNTDCELLCFSVDTGKRVAKGEERLKEERWATWSCTPGCESKGCCCL